MKKPNITEGEWYANIDQQVKGIVDENRDTIAVIHSMREVEDAKAISAVPDMIDALIGLLHSSYDAARMVGQKPEELKEIIQAERALTKAGVK